MPDQGARSLPVSAKCPKLSLAQEFSIVIDPRRAPIGQNCFHSFWRDESVTFQRFDLSQGGAGKCGSVRGWHQLRPVLNRPQHLNLGRRFFVIRPAPIQGEKFAPVYDYRGKRPALGLRSPMKKGNHLLNLPFPKNAP